MNDFDVHGSSALGDFRESPLGDRDPACHRWSRPNVYWRFESSYAESTGGGRIWTPTGTTGFTTGFIGPGVVSDAVHLGPLLSASHGRLSLPSDAVLARPNCLAGDFTLRLYLKGIGSLVGGVRITRPIYKANPATFGYHQAGVPPNDGWSIEYLSGTARSFGFFVGGSSTFFILPVGNISGLTHTVITFDATAQELRSYAQGAAHATVSTAGQNFVGNSESLHLSNEMFDTGPDVEEFDFVQVARLGIWDYAWTERQVECDYLNSYQWP